MIVLCSLLLTLVSGVASAGTAAEASGHWDAEAIRASYRQHADPASLPDQSRLPADPRQMILVMETDDHHVTLLDGERFEPFHRFPTRALHGSPKYSPDGRFVYLVSRDGWVSKYDLYALTLVAEVRAGLHTRNLAISADGRYLLVANQQPQTLVLLDASTLQPIKLYAGESINGKPSGFSAVYTVPPRETFVVALLDIPEIWEISYADHPPPGFGGWVHDFNPESGDEVAKPFPLRRLQTRGRLDDFAFDPAYEHLVGSSREAGTQVLYLYIGRRIATLDLPGLPRTGSASPFCHRGRPVLAIPNLERGIVSIVDMTEWTVIKHIETLGPGFFLRTHAASPTLWVDVFAGPDKDAVQVIDKHSLEVVATLRPEPGRTAAHIEFSTDGRHALVSVRETDGALVIYDAHTLNEIKRLPMRRPLGKYRIHTADAPPTADAAVCTAASADAP